ncbi:MAG: hypothetical protein ABSA11_09600 [Candidatus Bathyarchaeia archaeon]
MTSIPSDGRPHPALFIGVQDISGKPYPLSQSLNVTLTSSDSSAISLPGSVLLTPASYYAVVNASSNVGSGKQVEITASSTGFQSTKTDISVGPPAGAPSALKVTILPDVILPEAGKQVDLLVTLVDGYGSPTPARTDLSISLFSSNPTVGDTSVNTITILAGSYTAKTSLMTTGAQGTTTITASSTNLKSDAGVLTVNGPKPVEIILWALNTMPVNDQSNVLFVGVADSNGNLVKTLSPITIKLYSSDPNVVSVQDSVVINTNQWQVIVPLNCLEASDVTITAAAENLASSKVYIRGTSSSSGVVSIKIYPLSTSFPADEANQQAMLVQTVDLNGAPTASTGEDLDLFSSSVGVASPQAHVQIPAGQSAALVSVTTKLPGNTMITAGSQFHGSATANLISYAPIPDNVKLETPPIPNEGEVEACLLTLKGTIPAPVSQDTLIQLVSSDTQVGISDVDSVLLNQKTYMKYLNVKGGSPGQFSITASASGIPSSKIDFTVLDTKPSTFNVVAMSPAKNFGFPILIQICNLGGNPSVTSDITRINVVSSNASNIEVPSTVELQSDRTEILFYAKALSSQLTTLTVSSPGFKSSSIQLIPSETALKMQLNVGSKMPINKLANISVTLTINDAPIQGATVNWKGTGLTTATSVTDSSGNAKNGFTLTQQETQLEATVNVGGGYLNATQDILAVPDAYNLVVSANVPISVEGSGTYNYGDTVSLDVPSVAPMPSILGILGGKYIFNSWVGTAPSTSNHVSLTIDGEVTDLTQQALFSSDYTMLIVSVALIAVVILVAFFLYRRMKKKKVVEKPKDKKPIAPVVKPSPVRHH